jgi:hypothetical protein
MIRELFPALILNSFFLVPAPAQFDNFNDGNDDGWSRLDSIGSYLGFPYAQHAVINGRYRLTCPTTPAPNLIGNARVASYRPDTVMSDFVAVVDAAAWDNTLNQAFGLMARLQSNPGLGAVFCYAMAYQPIERELEINLISRERAVNLATIPLTLASDQAYRFVFTGQGSLLQAAIYRLNEPLRPLATIRVVDDTYAAGHGGLYGLNLALNAGTVDVTFDNYTAGAMTTPELTFSASAGLFAVEWPRRTGAWHLESSPNLLDWSPVRSGGTTVDDVLHFSGMIQQKAFYRLAEGW